MTEVFCKAKGAMCDPKYCNRELCWWRDTVWAIKNMASWAYNTNEEKPKPANSSSNNTDNDKEKSN